MSHRQVKFFPDGIHTITPGGAPYMVLWPTQKDAALSRDFHWRLPPYFETLVTTFCLNYKNSRISNVYTKTNKNGDNLDDQKQEEKKCAAPAYF